MTVLNIWTALIIGIIFLIICSAGVFAIRFANFRQWLIYAVSEAEKFLGSGTGKLKIRYAYDLALKKFPSMVKILPWKIFSSLIDTALIVMRDMVKTNNNIANYIENTEDNTDGSNNL